MSYVLIAAAAFLASGLTLFSGFGLGTMLMPVFALFFPVDLAIAATAVVHVANNLFKLALVGRHADGSVVLRFGIPAALAAFLGAGLLGFLAAAPALGSYELFGAVREIAPVKLAIGLLIVIFALLELSPAFAALSFPPRVLPLGGVISGFFGGLSGNQGAFRSAFLLKAGLQREAFIATGVVSAVIVDTARLLVYGVSFYASSAAVLHGEVATAVMYAIAAAFFGAFIGARLIEKVTLRFIQLLVAAMMIVIGLGLSAGLL